MTRLAQLISIAFAACSGSATEPARANQVPVQPPVATTPANVDCGTIDDTYANARARYECFIDAFKAQRSATLRGNWVTDEGGKVFITYRAVGAEVEVTTDDRDDGFAASPGRHVLHCRVADLAPASRGDVGLHLDECH